MLYFWWGCRGNLNPELIWLCFVTMFLREWYSWKAQHCSPLMFQFLSWICIPPGLHSQSWSYSTSRSVRTLNHICYTVSIVAGSGRWTSPRNLPIWSPVISLFFFLFHRYDVELYQRIEQLIGKKLSCYPTVEEEVMMLMERVTEAQRFAKVVSERRDRTWAPPVGCRTVWQVCVQILCPHQKTCDWPVNHLHML